MTVATESETRIYVACLAAYNNGKLHGAWIDAAQDADDIETEVKAMLKASPEPGAEEWAIHDYEGFHGLKIDESKPFDVVAELAAILEEHGEAYALYAGNVGLESASPEDFEEAYQGEWDSEENFTENSFRDCQNIPGHLDMYIDWASMARDWFCGDYYSLQDGNGQLHVFQNI